MGANVDFLVRIDSNMATGSRRKSSSGSGFAIAALLVTNRQRHPSHDGVAAAAGLGIRC
jgi:hypothetical protein